MRLSLKCVGPQSDLHVNTEYTAWNSGLNICDPILWLLDIPWKLSVSISWLINVVSFAYKTVGLLNIVKLLPIQKLSA